MITIIIERAGEDELIEVEKLPVGDCFFSGGELFLKCSDNRSNGDTMVEEDPRFFVWEVLLHTNRITQFSNDRVVTKVNNAKVVIGK